MNAFNRIIMVLLILGLIGIVALLLVLPLDVLAVARLGLDGLEQALYAQQSYTIFVAVCAALLLLMLILLWLEFRRPRFKTVQIRTHGKGNAQLSVDSVIHGLEYRIDELPGVVKVEPLILSRGRDVAVTLNLDTSPSVNIAALTDQIVELCHDIVENQLGVRIHGRVKVNVRHEPYPRGTMPARAKEVAPAPKAKEAPPQAPPAAEPMRPAPSTERPQDITVSSDIRTLGRETPQPSGAPEQDAGTDQPDDLQDDTEESEAADEGRSW